MAKGDKTANVRLPIPFTYGKLFLADFERLKKSGRYNMPELVRIMLILIRGEQIPPENRDHQLKGELSRYRECHIGGDFLLMYRLENGVLIFARTGTHSELFR